MQLMADFVRARSEEQKEQRMTAIKEVTAALFAERPYHEITLATIAERLGWSRGALYKYVSTKEEIFLELCADGNAAYVNGLLTAYPAGSTYGLEVLAEVWLEQICSNRSYFTYGSMLASVIETNVTVERLASFKARYYANQDRLIKRFSENLGIGADRANQLLTAVYYHTVGIDGWCQHNPLVVEAVELAGIQRRVPDFRTEMRDFIRMCLGYYTAA